MRILERLRAQPAWKDPDPRARRAALLDVRDPAVLAESLRVDPDADVRAAALQSLLALALDAEEEAPGLQAVQALEDPRHLLQVARSAAGEAVARAALRRLHDPRALGSIARHGRHAAARLDALARLVESSFPAAPVREELMAIALKSPHDDAALSALEHLCGAERYALGGPPAGGGAAAAPDATFLDSLAEHGRSRAAVRRARVLLHERQEAESGGMGRPRTDRRGQLRLCEEAESLARSPECEPLRARIAAAQDAWTDRVPHVDDDLDERFQKAIQAARERLKRNLAAREERLRLEDLERSHRDRHLAPRAALLATVEAAQGADVPRLLDDALWEWGRLGPLDDPAPAEPIESAVLEEARRLALRFERACQEAQSRYEAWLKEQQDERLRAEHEAARRERARLREEDARARQENLARLTRLCERAERLLQAIAPGLRKTDPVLRDVRAALEAMPPLPSRRDHDRIEKRLKTARAGLAPLVQELRDAEKWKRWANTNVQEDLCARAEALLALDDPQKAAGRLPELLERWRTAAVAEPDRSQTLWQRFKTATDEVRARVEARQAEHSARKRDLCEKAEALAASTDWVQTAEAIKALQAEWKTVGPAARGEEKALWERFRAACDAFFRKRDEDRARRREEWARNLEAKEALCARAEALAECTDWKSTAAEIKKIQSQWKTIGPIRPHRSEAVWRRFRSACDRFFERYKRRDEIDRALAADAREAICREMEALLTAPGPDLLPTIESAWDRWRKIAPPPDQGAPLLARFQRALDALIAAHPDRVRGTPFDVESNRRRLEDLCSRIEGLLPGAGAGGEHLSPATRLATMWREALASNTIGGKVAEEAKQRAAAEEARRAQVAWQKVGYVPEPLRTELAARFERACRRLLPPERESKRAPRAPAASGRR